MPIYQEIIDAVANENLKVVASAVSSGMAQAGQLAMLNATNQQQNLNTINTAMIGEMVLQRAGIDVPEAVATKKVAEADLSRTIAELGGLVTSLQQLMKGAQTTPPVT
jgi:hypothetical protein